MLTLSENLLIHTFSHIEGISADFEKYLWSCGIFKWDDFITQKNQFADQFSENKLEKIESGIIASKEALTRNDLSYFKNLLKPKEHWRLCHMGRMGYVDIETTGLSRWSNDITIIGIYDGFTPHLYVKGKNLEEADSKLKEFDIIVTFNGKQFDMPFIEHYFSNKYDVIHLDLRYMLKELGLQGGLKSIENQLGIQRHDDLHGIDGFEAVRLWREYQRGNQNALNKLLRYNEQDIINLKTLLQYYLERKQTEMRLKSSSPSLL